MTKHHSLFFIGIILLAWAAGAETIFVDSGATGAATGDSWKNAKTDLQAALKIASDSAEIFVAAGTYFTARKGSSRQESFNLRGKMKLRGGYPPGGGERDVKKNISTLSGDIARDDSGAQGAGSRRSDNSFRVVYCEQGTDVELDGFVIRGGGGGEDTGKKSFDGAGAYITAWNTKNEARCIIARCRFEGNQCNGRGAGLFMKGKDCTVEECMFSNNRCFPAGNRPDDGGGAAFFEGYSATIVSSEFFGNSAVKGGAVGFKGKDITIKRSFFFGNSATKAGGAALYFEGQTCVFDSTRFEKNSASSGQGGALLFRGRTLIMKNCDCRSNDAQGNGGVVDFEGDSCAVTRCIFSDNTVGHSGGALRLFCKSAHFAKCLFSGNMAQAGEGGSVYFEGQNLQSEFSIFSGNNSGKCGGALVIKTQNTSFVNDSFSLNTVRRGNGGAIYFEGDAFSCNRGIFFKNGADSGFGGAISLMGKEFSIRESRFTENTADTAGGIYCYNDVGFGMGVATKGLSISRCDFIGNFSRGAGGALCWLGRGSVEKGRFERNRAGEGGALFGWHHEINQKPYFRGIHFPIDSAHRELECKANTNARISGTIFADNHAHDGAVSAGWQGAFHACVFEKNTAETGKLFTGTDEKKKLIACTFAGNTAKAAKHKTRNSTLPESEEGDGITGN